MFIMVFMIILAIKQDAVAEKTLTAKIIQNFEWIEDDSSFGTDLNGGSIEYELIRNKDNKAVRLTAGGSNLNGASWIAFSFPQYEEDWTGMSTVEFHVKNEADTEVTFIYGFEDGNERWISNSEKNGYFRQDNSNMIVAGKSTSIPAKFCGTVQIPFESFKVHPYCFPEEGRNGVIDLQHILSRLYFEMSSADEGESILIDDFKIVSGLGYNYLEEISKPKGNFYNYCPSIIQTDDTTRYTYYCSNIQSDVIRDHIIMKKEKKEAGEWQTIEEKIVLAPSPEQNGWDNVHVCDPFVIRGDFNYNNTDYKYLMLYLGCATLDNSKNEIGIALSESLEGPWMKYGKNPVVGYGEFSKEWCWGVGQASAVNRNKDGKLILFYTRDDDNGTRGVYRQADFTNLDTGIQMEEEKNINQNGLTDPDGKKLVDSKRTFNNFEIAYNPFLKKWIGIRDAGPYSSELSEDNQSEPSYVSIYQEIFIGDEDVLWNENSSWQHVDYITPDKTGYQRNHNAGILTDPNGMILTKDNVEVLTTNCNAGVNALWTYRMNWYRETIVN